MNATKCTLASLLASLALLAPATAQLGNGGAHILLGGGYLAEPGKAFAFGQLGWTFYEDAGFAHTLFVEGLFHGDDAELDFYGANGRLLYSEDADIVFSNLTGNYELEYKLSEPVSLYVGGGAGAEIISINDHYDESIDDDVNFVAQVFAGVRIRLGSTAEASAGVRRIFREDFSLLGDQFSTEDAWAFDLGIGFRF